MRICPATRVVGVLSVLIWCGFFANCGAFNGGEKLTQITIAPENPVIAKGARLALTATGNYSNETTHPLPATAVWETSQSAVATVNSNGQVTGVSEGAAQLSVSYQGVTASTSVTVGPPALISITVALNQSSLPIGETEQLTAIGSFTDGTTQNLTQSVTWSSSTSTIASVSPTGVAFAAAVGVVAITATHGSITGSTSLMVAPAIVLGLKIVPTAISLPMGSSLQLQAIASFSDGTTQTLTTSAAWQTTQPNVAIVNSQGGLSAVGQGSAQVSATYQGATGIASVAIGPPALVKIAVGPSSSSLPVGESEQLIATGTFTDGTTQNLTQSAAWTSSSAAIASVSSVGTAVAITVGTVTITATSGSIAGSATLTVTPPVPIALNIVPASLSMVVGGSNQFYAITTFSNGATQDISATASWSSTQPSVATVSSTGIAMAMHPGSTTIVAEGSGLSGSASVTVFPLMTVSYFNRDYAVKSGNDGTIRLTNTGLTGGALCAMVYVFDQSQELNECCGCSISDSGLRTLSLIVDLTANTLTGKKPKAGSIKVVPADPGANQQCDPTSISPDGVILGWDTNAQPAGGGTFQVTEETMESVPLSNAEETVIANECSFAQQLGSGKGVCSCGTGDN
jgi:Bacterial Ig-like domain (group 2)